ncbi:uncharacterized protein [Atheta coriaria]|uniref:uncharacterized protein isoform X2 n=1 Tax=Dalotia coriaria TaxID=877792 RepID=UPI0031F33C9B
MQEMNNTTTARPPVRPTLTDHSSRLDNVLATQPEAGPVIPDGGYGWIILIASFYIKNILSGLTITYGLLLMVATLESGKMSNYSLWSNHIVSTPLLFIAVQSLSALVGICLICASILMLWLSVVDGFARTTLCVSSGIFAGFGSSLVFIQIDVSIAQYFRLKLSAVQTILRLAEYTGVIYTSLVMGKYLNMYGIGHSIIWYHLVVLTSGMVVLVFKKPDYLKSRQVYRIVAPGKPEEDDEDDIFSKNRITELQSPHTSLPPVIEEEEPSTATTTTTVVIENQRKNWETFDDEKETGTNNQHQEDNDEDYNAELPTPRELFTEGQINHNVTYSFENVDHSLGARANSDELTNIFLPVSKGGVSHAYLYSLSFYNNCLLQVSITAGTFVFFTLFPSYLYYSVSFLHTQSISHIVSIIFMASLVEACFIGCWKFSKNNRKFPIALLLWLSAIGNFLISDWKKEMLIVIGGILITTSTCALQFLIKSVVINSKSTKIEYAALRIFSAISFLLFFAINPTYENCFRLVGLLQFSAGSINFCNFVYNKISRVY